MGQLYDRMYEDLTLGGYSPTDRRSGRSDEVDRQGLSSVNAGIASESGTVRWHPGQIRTAEAAVHGVHHLPSILRPRIVAPLTSKTYARRMLSGTMT